MYKQYYDDNGALIYVGFETNNGGYWITVRQKKPSSGTHRVTSPKLPIRRERKDAQHDLDAYAIARKWDEAD